jgi:hypothetical protein
MFDYCVEKSLGGGSWMSWSCLLRQVPECRGRRWERRRLHNNEDTEQDDTRFRQ